MMEDELWELCTSCKRYQVMSKLWRKGDIWVQRFGRIYIGIDGSRSRNCESRQSYSHAGKKGSCAEQEDGEGDIVCVFKTLKLTEYGSPDP
jgi:hypothetical protein